MRGLFIAIAAIGCSAGSSQSALATVPPHVNKVRLTVGVDMGNGQFRDIFPYNGPCPVRVRFKAEVDARAKYIFYRWERSDAPSDTRDSKAEIHPTVFGGFSTETPIEDVRSIGARGQKYTGVQRLIITGLMSGDIPATSANVNKGYELKYEVTCWSPDLEIVSITNVSTESSPPCSDDIYRFRFVVRNLGTIYSPPTELWVVSQDYRVPNKLTSQGGWGNASQIPELQVGQAISVDVPIRFLSQDPTFMGAQPHTFSVVLDPRGKVAEFSRTNNSSTINVDPPKGCPMARGDAPPQTGSPVAAQEQQQRSTKRPEPPAPVALNRTQSTTSKKDAANCSDHPLFGRVQDYWIESCTVKPRDAYNFDTGKTRNKVEGKYWYIRYQPPSGLATKPSTAEVLREASGSVKSAGAEVVAGDSSKETLRLVRDGKETWVEAWADHTGKYILTIVERAIQ